MFRFTTALCALALLSGCAEEREPIDRVQPNYVQKSYLAGAWTYSRTVVDTPVGDTFTFIGDGSWNLEKIRWDIQESMLYGRKITEHIKGGDDLGTTGDDYEGEVVAAYRIKKHFDIARPYNQATGEELNIRQENSIDRPWHERTYMRVDWSLNLVTNADVSFEAESIEPVSYFVQDENHPDAPTFEDDYFDVTTRIFARAGQVYYRGYGMIPVCWLWDGQLDSCGPGEYTIRHSFVKIDKNNDYQPATFKGPKTELFGYFDTERITYNRQTGLREQNRERWMNRHNIWETSTRSVKRQDENGVVSEHRVPIPTTERTGKPLVYFVNRQWPSAEDDPVLNTAAQTVADQWNSVFASLVTEVGGTLPEDGKMFILCANNPVREGDHARCGEVGSRPKIGDQRKSFMAYLPDHMTYGLLGLGPSHVDPETGEIKSGMAYVYHHNDTAAWGVVQMVKLLNGTDVNEFIDGVDLTEWVEKIDAETGRFDHEFGLDDVQGTVRKNIERNAAKFGTRRRSLNDEDRQRIDDMGHREWVREQLKSLEHRGLLQRNNTASEARLGRLANTEIESMMMTSDNYLGMGIAPGDPRLADAIKEASVLRPGFRNRTRLQEELFEKFTESRNMYTLGMADDAMIGLAREYANRGLTDQQIYDDARRRIYTAVIAHEVGHSVGLMHNFGGSDDAFNYFDKYWELRTADGTVGPRVSGPGRPGDEITDDELDGMIYNQGYSSVMDYAGKLTVDGNGLGKYDKAAIFFGYGNLVEVYKDIGNANSNQLRDWADDDGEVMTWSNDRPRAIHYTEFYRQMGDLMWESSNRAWAKLTDLTDDYSQVQAGPQTGGHRVPYIYCSHGRSNLGDSCLTRDSGADSAERMKNFLDGVNSWYILRNFPRGNISSRYFFWNYVPRNYNRIYDRLKYWHDVYALYQGFLPEYYSTDALTDFYTDTSTGWGAQTWAIQAAFNQLVKTVLMPTVEGYGPETDWEGKEVLREWNYTSAPELDLSVADARYYSTSWSRGSNGQRDCGYYWHECLHHVGFYLDKIMAIEALTDVQTNFVARATPEDIREWQVGYYNTFSDQLHLISEGIMAEDYGRIAPYSLDGNLTWPNYAGDLDDVHSAPVDPYATFTVQLYWQVLGQARFNDGYDTRFAERSRIWQAGTDQEPTLIEEQRVTFTDPVTGLTYGARVATDGGSASALIDRANRMLARSNHCEANCVEPSGDFDRNAMDEELNKTSQLIHAISRVDALMKWGSPYSP
jgi:hypothetical protein